MQAFSFDQKYIGRSSENRWVLHAYNWFISVVEPVRIIEHPPERQKIGVGQSVRLYIRAEGTSPHYRWHRDRNQQLEPLGDGADFGGTTTATLCIKKATADLSGEYLCHVQNELSHDDSRRVHLDVSKSIMMYPITHINILCVHTCTLYVNCSVYKLFISKMAGSAEYNSNAFWFTVY